MSEEKTQVQNERKDLDILNKMKNLPGGLVIIPLVIAVVLATFVPQVFQIGGYVTALFYEGNACMMGFFLIVCGSMIDIKQVGMPLYKGVIMTGTKFLLGVIVGLIVGKICGPEGPRNRTICINCNNYKLKWITVHFPFFTVRKCNRYRSYLNPVTE